MAIFNADTQSRKTTINRYLNSKIKAPVVSSKISTLGGVSRASVGIYVSLDPKSKWPNDIFYNSRYFIFSLERDGTLSLLSKHYRITEKLRKSKVTSLPMAVAKINQYIEKARGK